MAFHAAPRLAGTGCTLGLVRTALVRCRSRETGKCVPVRDSPRCARRAWMPDARGVSATSLEGFRSRVFWVPLFWSGYRVAMGPASRAGRLTAPCLVPCTLSPCWPVGALGGFYCDACLWMLQATNEIHKFRSSDYKFRSRVPGLPAPSDRATVRAAPRR